MTDTTPRRRVRAQRPPTIIDVAEHAGVSRGTVSRVLQGGHNVSPAAKEAVNAAIRKLGYVVNRAARSLVTQRAGTVAFLLSETQDRLFGDPNFTTLLTGCTTALAEHDIPLILITAGTEAERRRIRPFLSTHHVDGVLLFSSHRGERGALSYVSSDDHEGARTMVRYLLESGRRRVATITGPQDMPGGLERLQGYREVLAEHGVAHDERLVVHGDYSRASGEAGMQRLLTVAPDLDAVFVASDLMAAGGDRACGAARPAGHRRRRLRRLTDRGRHPPSADNDPPAVGPHQRNDGPPAARPDPRRGTGHRHPAHRARRPRVGLTFFGRSGTIR
jgi:DNA-binding LacI/PurR family transcriptional regulator